MATMENSARERQHLAEVSLCDRFSRTVGVHHRVVSYEPFVSTLFHTKVEAVNCLGFCEDFYVPGCVASTSFHSSRIDPWHYKNSSHFPNGRVRDDYCATPRCFPATPRARCVTLRYVFNSARPYWGFRLSQRYKHVAQRYADHIVRNMGEGSPAVLVHTSFVLFLATLGHA